VTDLDRARFLHDQFLRLQSHVTLLVVAALLALLV
jgi:hypothetical protein